MTDLFLAILHHLLAFGLVAILAAQFTLVRPPLAGAALARLARLDAAYGATAAALVAVGIARLAWGARGADYYLADPWFWAKMAAFAAIGGLSAVPTLTLMKWRKAARADATFAPTAEARRQSAASSLPNWPWCRRCWPARRRWRATAPSEALARRRRAEFRRDGQVDEQVDGNQHRGDEAPRQFA